MKFIKITAPWCLSCIFMNEKLKKMDLSNYEIIELDYDSDLEKIKEYEIGDKLPVYIILDSDNKEIKRLVGEKNANELKDFFGVE